MGLFSRIFSNTFNSNYRFRRLNESLLFNNNSPVLIDTENSLEVYERINELQTVIFRKATMFSNGRFFIRDSNGEIIESDPLLDLLKSPNAVQSGKEWMKQHKVYEQLFGDAFIYMLKGMSSQEVPSALWNLPSQFMSIKTSGKIWEQTDIKDIIDYYLLKYPDFERKFEPNDVIHKNVSSPTDPIKGQNRLESLKYPLSNIKASYEHRNVIMSKKGAIGILSNQSSDGAGALPMSNEERRRIEKDYQRTYGIGEYKMNVILTNSALSWQPMSYPTKDLLLLEENDFDFLKIIDAYGLNANMFSRVSGATFENQKEAEKLVYQNTIIPEANDFVESLNKGLGLENKSIELDYSHLPSLQENEKEKAETRSINIDSVIKALEKELISPEEAERAIQEIINKL